MSYPYPNCAPQPQCVVQECTNYCPTPCPTPCPAPRGFLVSAGPRGPAGGRGPRGPPGGRGPAGGRGPVGPRGTQGVTGDTGDTGDTGATGATGAAAVTSFAEFFALMPPDNAVPVAVGGDVDFPQDGPTSGNDITRLGADSFELGPIGTYSVYWQVSVTEPGQLILTLNGADLAYTVVGRATGTSQIVGIHLVTTTTVDSVLTVRNPTGNSTALTITPIAGGTRPVSASLVITRLA